MDDSAARFDARSQLDFAMAVVKRMLRYWWLAGALAVVGAILAIGFSIVTGRTYLSETVIMHREIIPARVLQGPNAIGGDRNMDARFRDMIRSSGLLAGIIERNKILADVIDERGHEAAIVELRERIKFRSRGGGTFHLSYSGESPDSAMAVTQDLAESLIREELAFRRRGVKETRAFLERELEQAERELHARELAQAEFLAKHPEFADDATAGLQASKGASIRALRDKKPKAGVGAGGDPTLATLRRQRARIQARLKAKPTATGPTRPSPELADAQRQVEQNQRELDARERDVEGLKSRFTDQHPDVLVAKDRARAARRRLTRSREKVRALERVEAAQRAPTTTVDRDKLRADLSKVEAAITAHVRSKANAKAGDKGKVEPAPPVETALVELETDWSKLLRAVDEARERLEAIEGKSFTAEIFAASEIGGQGAQLEILDPASKPTRPSGIPRRLMALAGFVAFGGLGFALALILALADDRLFTASDWARYGLGEPLVIPSPPKSLLQRVLTWLR